MGPVAWLVCLGRRLELVFVLILLLLKLFCSQLVPLDASRLTLTLTCCRLRYERANQELQEEVKSLNLLKVRECSLMLRSLRYLLATVTVV